MPGTEYKVLPAPNKGLKGPGVKGSEARFAHALEALMNEMAAEGWHYLRSDMLPHEERHGIRSSQTTYRSVLVFRRDVIAEDALGAPAAVETEPQTEEHEEYHADHSEPEPEPEPELNGSEATEHEPEHESETPPEQSETPQSDSSDRP